MTPGDCFREAAEICRAQFTKGFTIQYAAADQCADAILARAAEEDSRQGHSALRGKPLDENGRIEFSTPEAAALADDIKLLENFGLYHYDPSTDRPVHIGKERQARIIAALRGKGKP